MAIYFRTPNKQLAKGNVAQLRADLLIVSLNFDLLGLLDSSQLFEDAKAVFQLHTSYSTQHASQPP